MKNLGVDCILFFFVTATFAFSKCSQCFNTSFCYEIDF